MAFKNRIRSILNLVFFKEEDIIERYIVIRKRLLEKFKGEINSFGFLDYFEQAYIGDTSTISSFNPRFPPSLWSVHSFVKKNLPRTNNALESTHHTINMRAVVSHVNI